MRGLRTNQLRKAYLDFFTARAHRYVRSDSLVPANDPSVLFTSAGMNQFKDHFLGKVKDFPRATSCQKCLRTGDLDEVGRTPFHHTFFEMLGNFSFGDYFKKEAILWAWEFVTQVLQIRKDDLWVSVYEKDEEAFDLWQNLVGLESGKIKKLGAKDNFWPSNAILDGPNGPCGPCSEIYFQKPSGESVEIWNLVFTQSNRCDGGVLEALPSKNIDTGMGLERIAAVLQGVESNFEIDIFLPIIESLKRSVEGKITCDEKFLRLAADHARAVTFCIGDGVLPSNDGRGYVVRKLIRRVLSLSQTKKPQPFLYKLVASVVGVMSEPYPELLDRRDNIAQIVLAEEEKYIRNILEGGMDRLRALIADVKSSGKKFLEPQSGLDLYVTYGVGPDLTQEACRKEGLTVDLDAINDLIRLEQEKSRASSRMASSIFSGSALVFEKSEFVGYSSQECEAKVLQIIKAGTLVDRVDHSEDLLGVILDRTPFYAESGGQVGDTGFLVRSNQKVIVKETRKDSGAIIHSVTLAAGQVLSVGDQVSAQVDQARRKAIQRSHTATHVLQAVLRRVLGSHVQQAGSLVEPDRFRFDFTHFKDLGDEEIEDIRRQLIDYILKNDRLNAVVLPKEQALQTGALALFGEKYEDVVRVVSIGDYSREFCGGTHLDQTGEIGLIQITSESSVGSGLRRIEALTGLEAFRSVLDEEKLLLEISARLKAKPGQLLAILDKQASRQKGLEKEVTRLLEKELDGQIESLLKEKKSCDGVCLIVHHFNNYDMNLLRKAADLLKRSACEAGVFFLSSSVSDSMFLVCAVTPDLVQRGLSADRMMKRVLESFGGSGGGRPDFSQGGLKDIGEPEVILKGLQKMIEEAVAMEARGK